MKLLKNPTAYPIPSTPVASLTGYWLYVSLLDRGNHLLPLPKNQHLKDQILLHIIVLIWGYTGIIGKWTTLSADKLVLLRMAFAFASLALVLRSRLFTISRQQIAKYLGVGVLIAAHWVTFFAAIHMSNVSTALSCMASTSLFAAFLEPLFFRRRLATVEVLTSLMALVGVGLLFQVASQFQYGILTALISAFFAALFTILNGVLYRQAAQQGGVIDARIMTCFEMLGGVLALCLLQLVWQPADSSWLISAENLGLAAILGIICTAVPFVISIQVMRSVNPFTLCLTINLEPIYAILLSLLHFGDSEKMSPAFYGSAALIIAAVMANGLIKARRPMRTT